MPLDMEWIQKIVWLALIIAFAIGEAATVGLTSIWFAAGSLAALIVALLGGFIWFQLAAFIIVSFLCMLIVRPIAKKHLNNRVQPTNVDGIIGKEALVTEDIDNLRGTGTVTISGIVWTARSAGDAAISAGTLVRVLRIEGVKVYVEQVKTTVVR